MKGVEELYRYKINLYDLNLHDLVDDAYKEYAYSLEAKCEYIKRLANLCGATEITATLDGSYYTITYDITTEEDNNRFCRLISSKTFITGGKITPTPKETKKDELDPCCMCSGSEGGLCMHNGYPMCKYWEEPKYYDSELF